MDSQDGWRLRPEAQPVSYLDPRTGQWTSGSFDTAVKSEHPAVRSSGVQPQATAGQVPQLPSDCLGIMPKIRALAAAAGQPMSMGPPWPNPWAAPMQEAVQEEESASPLPVSLGGLRQGQTTSQLQSDVRPDEQAELRRQESGAPPQSMPALYQAPPPSAAFAAAAQHGSASTPALDPWDGMHRTSGHMPTTSATDAAQKWLNALIWGAKGSAPTSNICRRWRSSR